MIRRSIRGRRWIALVAALVLGVAHAHSSSNSFLALDAHGDVIDGRWDIALRDLDYVLGLDADHDGRLTWGEVRMRATDIETYALGHLLVRTRVAPCPLQVAEPLLDHHVDGTYVVLQFTGACRGADRGVDLAYGLLFDVDTMHRGLLKLTLGGLVQTAVLGPTSGTRHYANSGSDKLGATGGFVSTGVQHILHGYDHLLFLCSLLLPAVLVRVRGSWLPATTPRPVVADVMRTVTAFTVAHSITFMLAAYGTVQLPTRLVESAIAASVVVAALNNVWPLLDRRRWLAAFGFGLVHGFGFASVLTGLDLPPGFGRALPLLGFNVGVELGQLAVVLLLLPVLYALRWTLFYRRAVLVGGSTLIVVIATTWFCERAFAWSLPSW